ncbi:uncharacterized protein YueI [Priestia aryabhattai]
MWKNCYYTQYKNYKLEQEETPNKSVSFYLNISLDYQVSNVY